MYKHTWSLGRAIRLKAPGKIMSIYDKTQNESVKLQCIEALAFYVIIYELISSTSVEVMTSDALKPRI